MTTARGLRRLTGLIGRRGGAAALHIPRCRSVHTFGMRFALDLVWLGPGGEVVRVDRAVPPRRVRWCRQARSVLELRAGSEVAMRALRETESTAAQVECRRIHRWGG